MLITILKVILTIILIPIKVIFFIFAYIIRIITYLLHLLLYSLSVPFEAIGSIVSSILVLGSIGATVFILNQISSGETPLSTGIFLIVGMWITSILLILFSIALEEIADALLSFGELMTDWAKANWFAFW